MRGKLLHKAPFAEREMILLWKASDMNLKIKIW